MPENVAQLLRRLHREQHPDCTYGDQPHYVPPSLGQIGFYLCDVPEDLRDHARCAPAESAVPEAQPEETP